MSNKARPITYVMYGFNLSNVDMTAYFGQNLNLVTDISMAKRFPTKKAKGQKGFGTPHQWLRFINTDSELNKGYKFHLVPVES